jgi:sugar phosphate isomerase/epimerase
MKLGAFLSCLSDRPLDEALTIVSDIGLSSVEITAGGFLPPVHLPIDQLRASTTARQDYLGQFADHGIELTALNANGNPLHPDPEVGPAHAGGVRTAVEMAGLLGVGKVVVMAGLPAGAAGDTAPSWSVAPWDSAFLDIQDYQWNEVGIPFWRSIDGLAREHGVKVCVEMHPHTLVYNTATFERLLNATDATNIGAQMDPSHLFWQGIDPITVIEHLGDRVYHAAAKDTRINERARALNGVLNDSFRRIPAEDHPVSLGGRYVVTNFPEEAPWNFVAIGRGHDVDYWSRFLSALHAVNPTIAVNIEHEDGELGQVEGLTYAASSLQKALAQVDTGQSA